jgi:hypothetical protein
VKRQLLIVIEEHGEHVDLPIFGEAGQSVIHEPSRGKDVKKETLA